MEEEKNQEIYKDFLSELRNLNKEIKEYNKSNEKITFLLFSVAILQLVVAVFQLIASFYSDTSWWTRGLLIILMFFGLWIVYRTIEKELDKKDNGKL